MHYVFKRFREFCGEISILSKLSLLKKRNVLFDIFIRKTYIWNISESIIFTRQGEQFPCILIVLSVSKKIVHAVVVSFSTIGRLIST